MLRCLFRAGGLSVRQSRFSSEYVGPALVQTEKNIYRPTIEVKRNPVNKIKYKQNFGRWGYIHAFFTLSWFLGFTVQVSFCANAIFFSPR